MNSLVVELPCADIESGPLAWLRTRAAIEQPAIALRTDAAAAIGIAVAGADGSVRSLLSVPMSPAPSSSTAPAPAPVEIAPGLSLQPPEPRDFADFLQREGRGLDHLGINFSHRAVAEPAWQAFVAELGARVPAWRLEIGAANDIVFVVLESAVVELVYDRAATRSSVHFCVRVAAGRAELEREFAAPRGGYKAGDEAFFRSVALPSTVLPVYADLAFREAQIAPWPQTLTAIGRRLG